VGPLARSLDDVETCFQILAGPDGIDTDVPPVPVVPVEKPRLDSLRIAWAPTLPGVPVAQEVRNAVHDLAIELDRNGARVEERLPDLDFKAMFAQIWPLVRMIARGSQRDAEGPPTVFELYEALDLRDEWIRVWDGFLSDWDALLLPPCMVTAFAHSEVPQPIPVDAQPTAWLTTANHTAPFNLSGQPALVLPAGQDSGGLPIGVQIIGRRWHDERLLAIGRAIAEVTPSVQRPPISKAP